jgi:hypothetical protein
MSEKLKPRSVALISALLALMCMTLLAGVDRVLGVFTLIVGMFIAIALFMFMIEVLCWIIPPLKAFVPWKA